MSDEIFTHNADLASAFTIPSHWYTTEESYRQDLLNVFNRSWNLIGSVESFKSKGDFVTAKAGLENFLVVKGEEGLRGFVNVCRHRAGPLAKGCGNSSFFQCQYHGWTYNLDGHLIGTPEFQGVKDFKREDIRLPPVSLGLINSLIFASLEPSVDFKDFSDGLSEKLKNIYRCEMTSFAQKDYAVDCNWKVYVDNYLEGYHLPHVHKRLSQELDYSQYRTETYQWYSEQKAPAKQTAALYRSEQGQEASYYWLFPNTMLNIYQGILQTNVVIPISPSKTIVKFVWYTSADNLTKSQSQSETQPKPNIEKLIRFSDEIQEEDRVICELVQQNLNSKTYASGRYSVKRENGVHHFHHLLTKLRKGI